LISSRALRRAREGIAVDDQAATLRHRKELGQAGDRIVAPRSDAAPVRNAEQRVRTILDQRDPVVIAEPAQLGHRLRQAEVVGREHGAHPREVERLEDGEIGAARPERIEDRPCADVHGRRNHRGAVVRGHEHAIAAAHAERAQREGDGRAAARGEQEPRGIEETRRVAPLPTAIRRPAEHR
jgi:hypothetical protein